MHSFETIACVLLAIICCAQGQTIEAKCKPCPPALISPICGSDGRLYKDQCDMKDASCQLQQEITEVPWSECKPKTCIAACTYEYTPVCGEDGKIYQGNKCTFLWESCGKQVPLKEAPMSTCEKQNK